MAAEWRRVLTAVSTCGFGVGLRRRSAVSAHGQRQRPRRSARPQTATSRAGATTAAHAPGRSAATASAAPPKTKQQLDARRLSPALRRPALALEFKKELVKHTTTPRGDHGTSAARQASCISAAARHCTLSLTCHSPVTHGRRGAGELSCFEARDWLMGAVPLWWVHFGVECSPIYLLAAARAFERSFFATLLGSGSGLGLGLGLGVW